MYCGEGGERPYTRRLQRIAAAYGVNLADLPLFTTFDTGSVLHDDFQHAYLQSLKDHQPAITILEPYYAYHGSASEGKMIAVEGEQLVWMSNVAQAFDSSLIIGHHYRQTGGGSALQKITGVGGAEWSDSWWLVEKDENTSDVTVGHFDLRLAVGSRQWGAVDYDIVIDIGPFDDDTMDNEGEITWSVTKHIGSRLASGSTANLILALVTTEPFLHTQTEILAACAGHDHDKRDVFRGLSFGGKIVSQPGKHAEGNRFVTRDLWGPNYAVGESQGLHVLEPTPDSEED
jgi:hypothetical protein